MQTFGIAGVENVTVQVGPLARDHEAVQAKVAKGENLDSDKEMSQHLMAGARVRYAKQGASDLVLFPVS